ncbi:DUF349 domain-containing protein [Acaricomes phytoseiuli]|nr:DUF349 domain-containing protein [Acaricomes phytoseiuli]
MTESQQSDETPETEQNAPVPASPAPSPSPGPAPTPSMLAGKAATKSAAARPASPKLSEQALTEAKKFGRADQEGHVFVIIDGEEIPVGQYPSATPDEALSYFARKFEEITGQIALLSQRIAAGAPSEDMPKALAHLREQLAERKAVGDIKTAEAQLEELAERITDLQQAARQAQEATKAAELAAREAIVTEVESLAGQDPAQTQWKASSTRMNELFESWKEAQRGGVRLGRAAEDVLWKRFRAARTTFDRHRRAFFSELDSANTEAKQVKEKLVEEAQELSSSTDWGATAGEYRRLMDRWKAAPRGNKKDDDALWGRFRAAQDAFFSARQAANDAIDQEYSANLLVKEQLLSEAKALLPIKDLASAKRQFQAIRDRWEDAGKVPRADIQRMESGLRSVEDALRTAENEHWKRTDPEARARTNSVLSQLEAAIAALEADLAAAKASGNERKVKDAQDALDARQAWLAQIQKSAGELG